MAEVTVRLYNVGFGDCFLLEFPRDDQTPYRVLIDCGSHSAGHPRPGWKIGEIVSSVIADTGGAESAIDVVVASHRHQDHVSGFGDPAWKNVTVGEVWLPWTEDPNDTDATRIRTRQSSLALNLTSAFADASFNTRWRSQAIRSSLNEMVTNSLTNERAMHTLHHGFSGKPRRRFLSTAETRTIEPAACPGLTVHLLGPSRDEATIRDMDPPSSQSYLRFGATPPSGKLADPPQSLASEPNRPFARNFVLDHATYPGPQLSDALKKKARDMMRDTDIATAVSLDKAINGTSLMLMFEFGAAYLLFPGDAQWGTWNAAMEQPGTRNLLAKTTFYKVGHHGSHNATPKKFLEEVLDSNHKMWGCATSVHAISFWPQIPRLPLIDELANRSEHVVRSDTLPGRSRTEVKVRRGKVAVDLHVPC